MTSPPLPPVAQSFVGFAARLRRHGFAIAPEQTTTLMEAVTLLGPRSLAQIRLAAHAIHAPAPERRAEFDAVFDAHFLGLVGLMEMPAEATGEEMKVQEPQAGFADAPISDEMNEAGLDAARAEALNARRFAPSDDAAILRALARELPTRLPHRRAYRMRRARRGAGLDLRRSLKEAARADGEVLRLRRLRRRRRPRNLLLLIDVSGSMKTATESHLTLAHVVTHALERVEVFTFGTRLTRLTPALRLKQRDQALAAAAGIVSDWDGGTRIGDALQAFLAVPRFAAYARGAVVVVLSDGLERGDPSAMRDAVARLSRRAWRLDWLSPLAIGPGFRPQTEGMTAILPSLDDLADGSSLAAIARHLRAIREPRAA